MRDADFCFYHPIPRNLEPIPKLAMDGNKFAPDDDGTSELNESEIIGSFLLKADE